MLFQFNFVSESEQWSLDEWRCWQQTEGITVVPNLPQQQIPAVPECVPWRREDAKNGEKVETRQNVFALKVEWERL